jgi:hypothetical protein
MNKPSPRFARPAFTITALSALSLLAAAGCNRNDDDVEEDSAAAELALDASDSGQAESSLLAASIDGMVLGQISGNTVDVTAAINARLSARFSPAGCVSSTPSGSTLTITFNNCTGPRGLRQVNGTLTLSVTAATASSISLTAKATDFQIGGATLDLDTSASYAMSNGAATLTVQTASSGVGPFGHEVAHTGAYSANWDAGCTSIEGDWSTSLDGRARSISVDVTRCSDSCAVGTVTRTTRDGRTITITLDGSVAAWVSSTGRSGSFALRCGR